MANPNQIFWPSGFEPEKCPIHVHNELAMAALPETVWAWLIRAQLWPTWYPNSANIQFLRGQSSDLALGTRFRWKTFGVTIVSTVLEFVPYERLAWDARGNGLSAYHAWLIQKTEQGCIVVMEETQRGWLNRLGNALRPKRIQQQHQIWLEGLRAKASSGLPPAP
ncbi:MAG: SRPBCC domain-containing protein [Candidatus Bathyarchaeia archaeon]